MVNKDAAYHLRDGGEKIIELDRTSRGELLLSTLKIFDDRNDIIARVDADDGFWVANSTRTKRPDKSTLVVFDHNDAEVLRLVFLNKNTLSVTGVFRHRHVARPVIITPDALNLAGNVFNIKVMGESAVDISIGGAPK